MTAGERKAPRVGPSPFARRIDQFLSRRAPSASRFLIACSGGPDSVALSHVFRELADLRGFAVEIGHVNHHLRGDESNRDEAFVRQLGRSLGFRVNTASRRIPARGNTEEKARIARYDALCAMVRGRRLQAVVTAHTMDDQAETVLMNVVRGAGLEGVAGIHVSRVHGARRTAVIRPMLGVSRADVIRYLGRRRYRVDASNRDDRFLRNYVRMNMFDILGKRCPGFQERIARLAELVRDELPVLERVASEAAARLGRTYRGGWLINGRSLKEEPVSVQRRVLRKAAGRDLLTFDGVERLRSWMFAPPSNGRIWQLKSGWFVERLSRSAGSPSSSMFWFRRMPTSKKRKKGR